MHGRQRLPADWVMSGQRTWWNVAAAMTMLLFLGWSGDGSAVEEGDRVRELIKAGLYREAYDTAVPDGAAASPAAFERAAKLLLRYSVDSPDNYVRWFAMRATRLLTEPELAEAVLPLARSGDRYVQALALEILTKSNVPGSREAFLEALTSPFRTVRLRALRGLARLKDPSLADRFVNVLKTDKDPELRALAARTLGATGLSRVSLPLSRALDDNSSLVQEEAVRALVKLGDPKIVGVLRKRLAEAPPQSRVGIIRLVAFLPDPSVTRDLGPFLGDGDPEVRAFAAAAILSLEREVPPEAP